VDSIVNGDTVIENFEGYAAGTAVTFTAPNTAGSPAAASTYLSAPNSSAVSQNNAFDGTNSCRVQWQFLDANNLRWAHILANGSTGKHYPQLDTTKPITARYLVLPVGETTNKLTLTRVPRSATRPLGSSVTFSVTAKGTPPFSYQWRREGADLPGATTSSYTIPSLSVNEVGAYTVVVTDANCTAESSPAMLTVGPVPGTITIEQSGTDVILRWAGAFQLQSATNVTGPYVDVPGVTTAPHPTAIGPGTTFFRLRD